MNGQHLRTFVWLRWRIFYHQVHRAGTGNAIALIILAVFVLLGVLVASVVSFLGGFFFVAETPAEQVPAIVMFVWDGMVAFFLFTWAASLLAELQRSDALSLDKFLHLPVSLGGVFALNYLSSLVCFTMAALLPIMVGFSLGVCFSIGPVMILVLPLLASFLLMVSAVSYQFQGWLASLMVNKRRRRTVIVAATFFFVLLCQLPNLVNFMGVWDRPKKEGQVHNEPDKEQQQRMFENIKHAVWVTNLVLPPGWLPLGAMAAAEGNIVPALLGTLGMSLIGAASLRRSYRTTIRLYTGHFTAGQAGERKLPQASSSPVTAKASSMAQGNMLEWRLPWISEQAAVIALGGMRSLLRAPEAKMLLLTPVFMLVIFGSMLFRGNLNIPEFVRPFLIYGAIAMSLFTLVGFVGNQFGFDRDGFRIFVLAPAPRRDILLGKNLAVLPFALVLGIVPIAVLQIMIPMHVEYILAVPAQFLSMFLLFCMLANWLSIFGPMPIAAGSLKPKNVKLLPILLQFLFLFLFPLVQSPTFLPLGIEILLQNHWEHGVYLMSTLIVCPVIVLMYWLMLTWQGHVLQAFELKILQTITTKGE